MIAFTSLKNYIRATKTKTMAQSNSSILLRKMRGQIGKQFVVKQYGKKTVITAYPDMSNVKPSKAQKVKRKRFAETVAYAQSILHDPVKKKAYALKSSVLHLFLDCLLIAAQV
jgi:hypothetical protein